jgi:hypothetical protein
MKIPFHVPIQVKKILVSRNALYVVFGMALLQWLYLMSINRFDLLIVFGLVAVIIYKYNRNMIMVLGIPFLVVLFSSQLLKIEGFEGDSDNSGDNKDKQDKKKTPGDTPIVTPHETDPLPPTTSDSETSADSPQPSNEHETTEAASKNEEPEFDPNQINYASTLTQNMKSYNELLGSDGFAKMSQDTQLLLQQQEQLGNAMKQFAPLIGQMTPFLEKASGLLNNMDMKQINKVANVFKNQ